MQWLQRLTGERSGGARQAQSPGEGQYSGEDSKWLPTVEGPWMLSSAGGPETREKQGPASHPDCSHPSSHSLGSVSVGFWPRAVGVLRVQEVQPPGRPGEATLPGLEGGSWGSRSCWQQGPGCSRQDPATQASSAGVCPAAPPPTRQALQGGLGSVTREIGSRGLQGFLGPTAQRTEMGEGRDVTPSSCSLRRKKRLEAPLQSEGFSSLFPRMLTSPGKGGGPINSRGWAGKGQIGSQYSPLSSGPGSDFGSVAATRSSST